VNGFEFFRIVKADDVLRQIPVIVLSGSGSKEDIIRSSKLGVTSYMIKPD